MRKSQFLLVIFLLLSVLLNANCITINPPSTPTPGPMPAPTPIPESQPIDIEAFISTSDWQPSYTIADLAQAKGELSNFFEEDYYAERPYIAEKYRPHDLVALKRALSDMNQLPWKYKAGYFDCSEMSALVQLYLKVVGFDAVIVLGRDPEVQGAGHAWNIIFLQQPKFEAVPIEPTSLGIPKVTGNVYGQPPNQVVMNYSDYLRSGWVLRDIYEAWVWRPHEFDWWNSYALSMDELFGEPPAPVPAPTPAPAPKPAPSPLPPPPPSQHKAKLMDETITVSPGKWNAYSVAIDLAKMPRCCITGSFTASGGSGNDIEFLVFDKSHYKRWRDEMEKPIMPGNPEDVPALYRSGRVTTATFDIPIARSDTYYLVWSNYFSTFTNKAVMVQVYLNYTK